MNKPEDKEILKELLSSQQYAVLSTQKDGKPYCSLIAFAFDENVSFIIFATLRNTRKYANMSSNPEISIIVDNRTNTARDLIDGTAITITGHAEELGFSEWDEYSKIYLLKLPHMKEFIETKNCALLRLAVKDYYISSNFISAK